MRNRTEEAGAICMRPLRSIIPSLALLFVVALAGSVLKVPTVAAVGEGSDQPAVQVEVILGKANPVAVIIEADTPVAPGVGNRFEGARLLAGGDASGGLLAGGVCDGSEIPENEPDCGLPNDTVNGGCNFVPELFSPIACGDTYCGTAAWDGALRDTDWYEIITVENTAFTWTVTASFASVIGYVPTVPLGSGDCATVTVLEPFAVGSAGQQISITTDSLPPGIHWFFVAPDFAGPTFTCGPDYVATLTVASTGACCLPDGTCVDGVTQSECEDPAGDCGNCDVPHEGFGCSDPDCEALVCAKDPFCCKVEWDQICADGAILLCNCGGGLGGVYQGDDTVCPGPFCIAVGACCQCDGEVQFCTVESEEDCAALGGGYLGDGAACEAVDTVTFSSIPNVAIPDNDPFGVNDDINVGESFTILDLEVQVDISHTWIGDLCVSLSKDGSPPELLMSRIGADTGGNVCHSGSPFGCDENDLNVVLDDDAVASIEDQCAAGLSGTYRPDPDSLARFIGGDSAGTWTLNVVDNAGGDLGTFGSWSITLTQLGGGDSRCANAFPDQCAVVPASIDIKPGSCPNPLNRNSNDVLPVAIVGTQDFDVFDVDVGSVLMTRADGVGGSVAARSSAVGDAATPFVDGELCDCHPLGGDGLDDLVMNFAIDELVTALGLKRLLNGDVVELRVSGTLLDGTPFAGTPFEGSDCIQLVDCPADLVVNGAVDVKDLLFMLGAWGPCPPKGDCPADLVVDGAVDVKDLLFLLGAWGPCP